MTEADSSLPVPDAIVELRQYAAVHLSLVAQYLTDVAAELGDMETIPVEALRVGQHALAALAETSALMARGEWPAAQAAYEAMPAPPLLKAKEAPSKPHLDFYESILPAEHFGRVPSPPPEQPTVLYILGPTHIAINGTLLELEGDELYMFNALLYHRGRPEDLRTFIAHDFRGIPYSAAARIRARETLQALCQRLDAVMPEGVEAVLEYGTRGHRLRQLSTRIVVKDARTDPALAQLVPRVPTQRQVEAAVAAVPAVAETVHSYSTRTAEVERRVLATRLSTAEEVVVLLQTAFHIRITVAQVHHAAAENELIVPVYNDGGVRTYSDYAVRKIAAALLMDS